ncbi:hypothetical protein AB0J82_03830 [Asanoa sp. NPDC049518]|uniref:hypothetical protein n=1 Tax=unclassified Asanoa TaxID=2685164 RepID=UPI00344A9C83
MQLYRPIGFEAGLSYLRDVAGPHERDETALLDALAALTASRAGWHAHQRAFDAERRAAKSVGHRSPRRSVPNPYPVPLVWYGAVRPAALHALGFWQERRLPAITASRDPLATRVEVLSTTCQRDEGELAPRARESLDRIAATLHDRLRTAPEAATLARTRQLLFLVRLMRTAADPSTAALVDPPAV